MEREERLAQDKRIKENKELARHRNVSAREGFARTNRGVVYIREGQGQRRAK